MPYFNIVAETSENTVVTEYEPVKKRSDSYQSEAALEQEFIRLLCEQGYEYLPIHTEKDLIANLRKKLEELNNYQFSDTEWDDFFKNAVANPNEHIVEKTRKMQEDNVQVLTRDDGSSKNITLIDKKNIHNNRLQVINQYVIGTENGAKHDNRYDVTVLVNGLPLVHIELKRRGVAIREAFNQINRYQRDSFWAGCGLYEYIQIFVISNGTNTKYYSNSTRRNAEKEHEKRGASKTKTSNSFEFTCFWADANNRVIPDLIDFTKTFFAKHTILNILTKYCIFTSEDMLMVMRPYQITATERILNRIEIANNYKKYGSVEGGGYIWHTTGSGKTLTSFKTARLASKLPYIDKVLFVVDRKDLDYQTSGFQPSDLILIAARPSMGKTAFVLNIAQYMAFRSGETVAIFSLEMSKEQLVNRLLSMESGVDAQKLRNGNLSDTDWERLVEGAEGVARSNLIIDDTPGITLAELRSKCRKYKLENKLGIIMIDYLQLMSGGGRSSDSRQQEISDISRGLKSLARELNVPVVALSQLSRAVEQRPDHRPMLSDLRESGAIEQDADMVMFLYRDSYYNKDTEMKNLAEVIVAKQRNGPIGTINLLWMPEYTTFKNFKPGPPM